MRGRKSAVGRGKEEGMGKEKWQEMAELAAPLAQWLKQNKNPYYSVIVTSQDVQLVCTEAMQKIEDD